MRLDLNRQTVQQVSISNRNTSFLLMISNTQSLIGELLVGLIKNYSLVDVQV